MNKKLLWILVAVIGGVLIGFTLDGFIFGAKRASDFMSLIIGVLFALSGSWMTLKS